MPAPGKAAEDGKRYFSFFIALLHPFSRGSVHIGSSDLSTEPIIDLHMVDNAIDMELMVQAIKYARKVVRTDPLGKMLGDEVIPGSEIETDEEIKEYIRNTVQTVFHPVGTSAMLPRNEGGVVDINLKVYGTKNLRVVCFIIIADFNSLTRLVLPWLIRLMHPSFLSRSQPILSGRCML